ncbi:MAG: aminoacyl-tRNA hydrolase [Patescibacteria group bacterium]
MFLIAGLGNPGTEYEGTRHNIGRDAVILFAKKNNFEDFEYKKQYNTQISESKLEKNKMLLAIPDTYMNKSGESIQKLSESYKLKTKNLFLVHDDIDLSFGNIKISFNKNSGGHKGIENVIKKLKTKEFWRIRVGINPTKKKKDAMDLVLKKFTGKDAIELKKINKNINDAILCAILESPEKAMTLYNQ